MTTLAATLPKKYLQARTTAGILNIVRIAGTVGFGLLALLLVIVGLVQWADAHTNGTLAVLTISASALRSFPARCSTRWSVGSSTP